jgi:integrase
MTINLRKRKQGKNGKISLYLEIYKGKTTSADGKTKYIREYQFLNLFLVDNPKTEADKQHNKKILQLAKNIKSEKELELHTNRYGFQTTDDYKDTNFYEYFSNQVEKKKDMPVYRSYKQALKTFEGFAGLDTTFAEITENFCEKYLQYLRTKSNSKGKLLEKSSVRYYFKFFSSVIFQAVKEKVITENPLLLMERLKVDKPEIVYLTFDELKQLVQTDCKHSILKSAFIFSCLTGLRWSDVYKLQWSEIQENQGKHSIVYRQKKTQQLNYLTLPDQALTYLGERGLDTEKVFKLPQYNARFNRQLQGWCKDAGINKATTFHSSRHTFAVLQLSLGTPIFTVQKLLGHSNRSSTMVYANIIDSEKERAMNIIPTKIHTHKLSEQFFRIKFSLLHANYLTVRCIFHLCFYCSFFHFFRPENIS